MTTDDSRFALFDGDDGSALLFSAYRRTLSFSGEGSPEAVFDALEAASAQGEWVALAADYGLGACFEPRVPSTSHQRPLLRGWVFGQAQRLTPAAVNAFFAGQVAALAEHERVAGVAECVPALDAAAHAAQVEQIQRWIAAGDCYQINLTFPFTGRLYGHPLALYAALRARQPVRYGAFIATPDETLLSFSPELFFERCGTRVVTRPMKGTAARGANPHDDERQRLALLASEKERAENIMIVDLLRNDLGRLAAPGQVRVDALCAAETYPTLWQMVSTISAELPGVRLFELFRALFPCGSITGAPKIRSMQCLAALEKRDRGVYTGALGYLAPGGDCRFNVAIRTLEVSADGRLALGVGGGIVIDSDPAREYAECLLKARFLTAYDPGFELIETLRLQDGAYPLLNRHLDRLAASARALGFTCDRAVIGDALGALAGTHAAGLWRVRLTLAHDGRHTLSSAALDDGPLAGQIVLAAEVLAADVLAADDYLLRHKTTARSRYDRALAALPDGVFDAIFCNNRGEVCEGARSNVFVERGGKLLTPPVHCGLLPGVQRQYLLDSGRAVECVLRPDDLLGASRLYVANALRGLIPVRLRR